VASKLTKPIPAATFLQHEPLVPWCPLLPQSDGIRTEERGDHGEACANLNWYGVMHLYTSSAPL